MTKGDLEDIQDKISILQNIENELQDFTVKQNDINGRRNADVVSISKKIENINAMLLLLQTEGGHKSSSNGDSKGPDLSIFNEIIKNINNQVSSLQNDCDEFRRYFTDILPMMKKLASIEDLKNLEEVLKSMLEEYKLLAQKKFADKIETLKSIKLVDSQLKHFISDYIKKTEKGENWMHTNVHHVSPTSENLIINGSTFHGTSTLSEISLTSPIEWETVSVKCYRN